MRIKSKLSKSDYVNISRLFSSPIFDSLATNDEERINYVVETFKSFYSEVDCFTLTEAYSEFYKILLKKYKNEYVFKNIVFKELILKNHKVNDCITIPEFNIGNSKADLAVFNGASTVYEIKSDIDTTGRLSSQMQDYMTFFEYLNVVISEKHIRNVEKIIPENVGIFILDEKNKLFHYKTAISNIDNITHKALFFSLRKKEYISVIKDVYGLIPVMPNTKIFAYCFDLFLKIDILDAYKLTLSYLKKRVLRNEHLDLIDNLPASLKCITIKSSYSKKKCDTILENIEKVHVLST